MILILEGNRVKNNRKIFLKKVMDFRGELDVKCYLLDIRSRTLSIREDRTEFLILKAII